MALRFFPFDRRVRIQSIEGVAAPTPPSRLWVTWPWEPFLTLGGAAFLFAALTLLTTPMPPAQVVGTALLAIGGIAAAVLGVVVATVRRRREALGFRYASMALLGRRSR